MADASTTGVRVMSGYEATIEVRGGEDFFTGVSTEVARVTWKRNAQSVVMLAASVRGGKWFPTWIGLEGEQAVYLPEGFDMPRAALDAIERAYKESE